MAERVRKGMRIARRERWVCHRSSVIFSLQLTAWRSSSMPQGHARLKALSKDAVAAAQKIDGPTSSPPELVEYALASAHAHAAVDSSTRFHHGRNNYSLLESSDSEE